MEDLSVRVSKLLGEGYTLVKHTSLTQGLESSSHVILWNDQPSIVSPVIYKDFKDSVRRRGSKFYNSSNTLSYADFCMSLLCARSYSLNHNSIPSIPSRAFSAAWRGIITVMQVSSERVKSWLKDLLAERSALGYGLAHNTADVGLLTTVDEEDDECQLVRALDDEVVLSNALQLRVVVELGENEVSSIRKVTNTPESQLFDTKLQHLTIRSKCLKF